MEYFIHMCIAVFRSTETTALSINKTSECECICFSQHYHCSVFCCQLSFALKPLGGDSCHCSLHFKMRTLKYTSASDEARSGWRHAFPIPGVTHLPHLIAFLLSYFGLFLPFLLFCPSFFSLFVPVMTHHLFLLDLLPMFLFSLLYRPLFSG